MIGRTTVEAMESGLFYGYVGMVEGLVRRMRDALGGRAVCVATGGLASVIAPETELIQHVDIDLTLHGLRTVWERNREANQVTGVDAAVSAGDYCRAIEHHLCQKNDGHLIRIVGPAFEVVSHWQQDGVPLKVALQRDRSLLRTVLPQGSAPSSGAGRVLRDRCARRVRRVAARGGTDARASAAPDGAEPTVESRGPSLPAHLERVVLKLSNARAMGRLGAETDGLLDRLAIELDVARGRQGA